MHQPISKRFPKDHQAFVGDKSIQGRVKSLEDRIEQSYQVHQLMQSLMGIAEIIETEPAPQCTAQMPPEISEIFTILLKDAPPPTQLDIDREVIWGMASRLGKQSVLGFLSPNLWQSLEVLFSGIVVSYIQMFTGGDGRSKLDHSQVFKGDDDLKDAHAKFDTLRNKQYAHKEFEGDRHQLSYFVTNMEDIAIDVDGVQHTNHYHLTLHTDLLKCLVKVSSYLKQDIKDRSENLINNLTEDQKLILLQ